MFTAEVRSFVIVCVLALLLPGAGAVAQVGVWWNKDWNYCLDFGLPMEEIKSEAITLYVDFTHIMHEADSQGELDRNSIRVLQVDDFGNDQNTIAPCLFEERIGVQPEWGYVTWLKGKESHHQIYFDTAKHGPKPPPQYETSPGLLKHCINLVRNPGFEHDKDGDGLPDLWTFAGHDIKARKWVRGRATSWVFSLCDKPVHSGKRSIRFALGKALENWKDFSVGHSIGTDAARLRGTRLNFRGYVYIASGAGVPRVRIRQFGKDGWITEDSPKPSEEITGKWLEMGSSRILSERATSFNIQLSERLTDGNADFYFDDFYLQPEYPDVVDLSLDKKEYYLSDAKAFLKADFNLDREVLMPMRATLKGHDMEPRLVTLFLKTRLTKDHIRGRKLRLVVEKQGKPILSSDFAVKRDMKIPLSIGKLKEGSYTLRASVVDDIGQILFSTTKSFSRIKGPFDF